LGARDLQSDLRAIGATAAEADLFAGFVLERHSTGWFAAGHAEYLEKQTRKLADKLSRARASSPVRELKDTAQGLASDLADALREAGGGHPERVDLWVRLRERSAVIRERAGRTKPSR
jgi:hypothetical protein